MFFKGQKDVYIPLSGHALIILGGPSPWYIILGGPSPWYIPTQEKTNTLTGH